MDYIDGETLDDYLAGKGTLSEGEAIKLLKPVAAKSEERPKSCVDVLGIATEDHKSSRIASKVPDGGAGRTMLFAALSFLIFGGVWYWHAEREKERIAEETQVVTEQRVTEKSSEAECVRRGEAEFHAVERGSADAESMKTRQEAAEATELKHKAKGVEYLVSSIDRSRDKVQLWEGGPYWADKNIGADTPWDSGYFFWWGDTIGYRRVNDAWVASDGSSSNFSFSSVNTPTYYKGEAVMEHEGWITCDGVFSPARDAAHVHLGGGWRMPTKDELGAF